MSIALVVTRGFGNGTLVGNISMAVTSGVTAAAQAAAAGGGGGDGAGEGRRRRSEAPTRRSTARANQGPQFPVEEAVEALEGFDARTEALEAEKAELRTLAYLEADTNATIAQIEARRVELERLDAQLEALNEERDGIVLMLLMVMH